MKNYPASKVIPIEGPQNEKTEKFIKSMNLCVDPLHGLRDDF